MIENKKESMWKEIDPNNLPTEDVLGRAGEEVLPGQYLEDLV